MTELEHFKYNMKYLLKIYEFSIEDFAKASGIPKGVVSVYMKGLYFPSLNNMLKIANVFHCSVSYLLGRAYLPSYTPSCRHVNFYEILCNIKSFKNVSFYKISKDTKIAMSCFTMWKKGVLPTINKLIILSNHFDVEIDCFINCSVFSYDI